MHLNIAVRLRDLDTHRNINRDKPKPVPTYWPGTTRRDDPRAQL